ncbi:MAG: tetratricopeptide repeat protein [Thermoanaerobaculia bacterium]
MVAEKSARSAAPRIVLALLVGGLVGFSAGYFAGGGGRPASESAGSAAGREAGGGDARLAELTRAVDRDPENPALLIALGNYRYDRDDWDGAIAAYEKARRKAPNDPNLLSDLGAAHRNAGEFELAVAYFKKARDADPEHWQSLLNWVLVEAFDRRNPAEAQRLFDELQRRNPEIPQLDRIQSQISTLRAG